MIEGMITLNRLAATGLRAPALLRVSKEVPPVFRKTVRIGLSTDARKDARKDVTRDVSQLHARQISGNGKYFDLGSYLDYAKSRQLSTTSTVFQGNFYELCFLEFLRKHFTVSRVIHQGGRDDKGIDIRAVWRPTENFSQTAVEKQRVSVNSVTRVKPIALKKDAKVQLFVQCKSWEKSRVDAKMVREINGTFNDRGRRTPANRSRRFLMLVCPTGFTRQGQIDFDRSLVPLIFIRFSKSRIVDPASSVYDLHNYALGTFESFYCNPMANALLKGLNWTEFINRLVVEQ